MGTLWGGFWYTLWRVVVVSTGFVLAAVTSILMLLFMGGRELAGRFSDSSEDPGNVMAIVDQVIGGLMFAVSLGPALTVVPALGAVILGEVARIRSVYFYVITGGLAVLAIPFLYETGDGISGVVNAHYMIIFLAAGFIGGFVYWLIAGRGA